MDFLDQVDIPELMTTSTTNVFETMLSMNLETVAAPASKPDPDGETLVGAVGFAGRIKGLVYIRARDRFARVVTGAMLGMEPDEFGDDEVNDVIGELSNMIGGNIKSRLNDSGFECQLSTPTVTRGKEFQIISRESAAGLVKELCFQYETYVLRVVVALVPGE